MRKKTLGILAIVVLALSMLPLTVANAGGGGLPPLCLVIYDEWEAGGAGEHSDGQSVETIFGPFGQYEVNTYKWEMNSDGVFGWHVYTERYELCEPGLIFQSVDRWESSHNDFSYMSTHFEMGPGCGCVETCCGMHCGLTWEVRESSEFGTMWQDHSWQYSEFRFGFPW